MWSQWELKGKYVDGAGTQGRFERKTSGVQERGTRGGVVGSPSLHFQIVLAELENVLQRSSFPFTQQTSQAWM